MPSVQRGSVDKVGSKWRARWYDESDTRRSQGGFDTRSAARAFVDRKVDEVTALRRGDPSALRRRQMPTLGQLVDEYVGQHNAEANTIRTLKARLRYATEGPKLDGQGGLEGPSGRPADGAGNRSVAAEASRTLGLGDHEGAAAGPALRRQGEAAR
jgi:hypothetical protein